jgi:hypothetical protein
MAFEPTPIDRSDQPLLTPRDTLRRLIDHMAVTISIDNDDILLIGMLPTANNAMLVARVQDLGIILPEYAGLYPQFLMSLDVITHGNEHIASVGISSTEMVEAGFASEANEVFSVSEDPVIIDQFIQEFMNEYVPDSLKNF